MSQATHSVLSQEYGLVVDGEVIDSLSGETFETLNPATESQLATVAAGQSEDIDMAVEAADDGFLTWKKTPPEERGRILNALAHRIREEQDRLAKIESLDNGKPLSQAEFDVEVCARYFEYYAGIADKIHGDSIPLTTDYADYTIREPLGVTGQIIPWNLPINIFGRSVAPALATGNVAVIKPAEQTPLTAIEVGKLALEVGVPDGGLNVVPGFGSSAGTALSSHPDVDAISFTGSIATGQEVMKTAADNITEVHLELGGKSPNVVFPDADTETALDGVMTGIFTNAGQVCSAGSRLLVHEDIHEEFVDCLIDRVKAMTAEEGLTDPDLGPLVSETQYEKVTNYQEIGKAEVGEPVVGGGTQNRDGYFVEPTIFDNVDNDDRIAQEEIFGPVLSVVEFADEDEAIELANDVDYGLVAGVFTENVGRAHRFARDIDAGQIYINEWFAGGVETPFGGFKNSGFGREKGLAAVESYTQVKNVCANIEQG